MCRLKGSVLATIPILVISIYFIFKFISALVDEYIEPSITYIKD